MPFASSHWGRWRWSGQSCSAPRRCDLQPLGIDEGIAQRQRLGKIEGDVVAGGGLAHDDVAIAVLQVYRRAGGILVLLLPCAKMSHPALDAQQTMMH
ncbi:hypothetical protein EJO68_06235 [Variovorax atrisoli]|uniref:hypothetical protein n=1 Tax=Variovorax atrisoli TaxID=3394203 RepID=UPI000F7F1073|nr:hypothetical protein [Variovorax sp. 369]RTD95947.1 hypothetical protein EJO68_06235 [Variovorax sp. 369]